MPGMFGFPDHGRNEPKSESAEIGQALAQRAQAAAPPAPVNAPGPAVPAGNSFETAVGEAEGDRAATLKHVLETARQRTIDGGDAHRTKVPKGPRTLEKMRELGVSAEELAILRQQGVV